MNENANNSILTQLRALTPGEKVRFLLRAPDGKVFPHISAIETRVLYPDGFDTENCEVAIGCIEPRPFGVNPHWASYSRMPSDMLCVIVGIERLAPELPNLETLQQWVADGTTVRIEYSPPGATVAVVGPSPVTSKLLDVSQGNLGRLNVRVPSPKGPWNMHLDASDAYKGTHFLPVVTSITPVTVAQTPEEIDTIMQRAAKSGAQVEAITAVGDTHIGDVEYCQYGEPEPYRVPSNGNPEHEYWWLGINPSEPRRRIVSVRELAAEKQTEAQMLELLQAAKRDSNHVEATMADGSKRTGPVCDVWMSTSYRPGCMVKCQIGDEGASFGAVFGHERIAAIKLLPCEEKRPQTVTFTGGSMTRTDAIGPYSLATGAAMSVKVEEKTHITPTCCADVALYIGRRVRVSCPRGAVGGQEGILTRVGINDQGDPGFWLDDDIEDWGLGDDYERLTIELLPDEPTARPCQLALTIEPKVPADLEPYIGRHVRVLAGEERKVVREGILTGLEYGALVVDYRSGAAWSYGPGSARSTLVEVLPELQDEEPDDSEDDADDDLEEEDEVDESVPSDFLHRACDATLGDFARTIIASTVESRLTLAGLLAMAPPPNDIRAYEAFQLTVREAMATGVIRG
jgi:hypothetical protein